MCFLRASPVANGNLWFTADLFPFVLNGRRSALNSILKAGRKSERENASAARISHGGGLARRPAFVKLCVGNCALEKWCAQLSSRQLCVCEFVYAARFIAIANGAKTARNERYYYKGKKL